MSKVLIVDDVPANLRIMREALEPKGYRIFGASNGESALRIAGRVLPDIILLDIVMPGMNGLEISRYVSEHWPEIPVILVSGKPPPGIREQVRALGLTGFLKKPFSPVQLVEMVEMALTG